MDKPYVSSLTLMEAADKLAATASQGGCYHWTIATKDKMTIAIVLGWTQYPDEDDKNKDKYYDDGFRLAVKVGYQPKNSIMQCDYDVDWLMPHDLQFGDCIWAEYCITKNTNFEALAKDINTNASWVLEHWKELGHE